MTARPPIRVVVADDSGLMRRLIASALRDAGCEVVASARDGDDALTQCERHRPDVLSLDLAMPGLDGIGVLCALRERRMDIPVVVVSAFSPAHGARAVDALAQGAFELVAKPSTRAGLREFTRELAEKVALAKQPRRRPPGPGALRRSQAPPPRPPVARAPCRQASPTRRARLVLIACSTGGPRALAELLSALPQSLGAGTLIVQHMPPGFTSSLAARLDRSGPLTVREAADDEAPQPGLVLMAPGGSHVRLGPDGRVRLSDEPPIGGLRPRADLTIVDAARIFAGRLVLVVLTGMGNDGLQGAREVRRSGGRVLVEAASTCTVYGMPRAVADANLAHEVLALDHLAGAIAAEVAA